MKTQNSVHRGLRRRRIAAYLWCLLAVATPNADSQDPPIDTGITVRRAPDGIQWRLQWKTSAGQRYRVQKSANIGQWINVTEVTASAALAQFDDGGMPRGARTMWRVLPLGEALSIAPVVASYQPGDTASQAMLQVDVGGSEPVASVVFFDSGVALGDAVPGSEDSWTFDLPWDGETTRTASITASVTGVDGSVRTSPVNRFLLADPAKFVPLKPDGKPAYGEFVPINGAGTLDAFLFYPEGFADSQKSTGAHFSFAAGSTVEFPGGAPQVRFSSASFHRGHADPAPLVSTPGVRTLPLNSIQAPTVVAALGLPAGSVIPLLWGPVALPWTSGALGDSGWAALKVKLPMGDFLFPGTQTNASVAIDPSTNIASLVVCFSGDWDPFANGPHFRIPASDPLKVYLDTRGRFAASGTAEAEFPNGASVRGSLSWRDPYFEFRFQGRGITIPALSSLRQVLPQNPEECLPAGAEEAELDEAAKCLAAYRDTFRQLATGGSGQADPAAAAALSAPLPTAEDPAGTALAGWAARLESWNADRAGQILDTASLTALKKAVQDGTKLAVASNDAPTVFKLVRDILSISRTPPNITGATPEAAALTAALDEAQPHLFAAAKRVASTISLDAPPANVAEAARLLSQWATTSSRTGRAARDVRGGDPAADEAALQADDLVQGVYGTFFDDFDIRSGEFDGSLNGKFPEVTTVEGMLDFLERTKTLLDLLKRARLATSLDDAPDNFPMREALDQAAFWVAVRHNDFCDDADDTGKLGPLRSAVEQRLRIFELYTAMGYPVPDEGTVFLPPLRELALEMEQPMAKQLATVSRDARLGLLKSIADLLIRTAKFLNDPQLNEYLDASWVRLKNSNSEMAIALFGAPNCDELERLLTTSFGFTLLNLPENSEGSRALRVNGKYESVTGKKTLQLNQGGRYLLGRRQVHSGTAHHRKLEGILMTDTPTKVEFAFVLYPEDQPTSREAGILTAERDEPGGLRLKVKLTYKFPTARTEEYRQTSFVPALAESVVNGFEDVEPPIRNEHLRIVRAFNRAPLHTTQLENVLREVPDILTRIDEFAKRPANSAQAGAQAALFDDIMEKIKTNFVTPEQMPLVRVVLQQVLSKARPPNSARTYWEHVVVMLTNFGDPAEHGNLMQVTKEMVGDFPITPFSNEEFTYECTFVGEGVERDFKMAKLGGLVLKIHIDKSGPTGSESFNLIGLIAQGGVGFESNPDPEDEGGDDNDGLPELPIEKMELDETTIVVKSPFDYSAEDLAGPVFGFSGEANFGAELKIPDAVEGSVDLVSVDASGLVLFGNMALPPFILTKDPDFEGPSLPEVSANFEPGEVEFKAGAEASVDVTVGYVTNEEDPIEFLTRPLPFRFDASAGSTAVGAVFFDTGSDVIKPCGRQFLRRLVAEYAGVFAGTNPKIRVIGMTDTAGAPGANQVLSVKRAMSVRAALIEIAGPLPPGFAEENILAIGLGEEAANGTNPEDIRSFGPNPMSQPPPNPPQPLVFPVTATGPIETNEPWVLEFIDRRQDELVPIPDNTGGNPGARWRSVMILINNVAEVRLTDPTIVTP